MVAPAPRPNTRDNADTSLTVNDAIDPVVTASTGLPSGWVVQIGAAATREGAEKLLAEAKSKAGGMINDAQAFTAITSSNGEQLHRARFAGFSGKSHAWKACKVLKKSGYGCWATQQ